MSQNLKHSPLEAAHVALGAKLVPFAGWNMPIQYSSIIDEHTAVRSDCGIFDISHMGQFFVRGSSAATWLNGLLTNDIEKLEIGAGQYTLMLNEQGGIIDDLIAYRTAEHEFLLVVNASMIDEDLAWLVKHQQEGVEIADESEQWAGMAIQGPNAVDAFAKVCPSETLASEGIDMWDRFRTAGAKPCGLGSRDTLRLEMGYPLNGNDLSPERTPLEAGLGFFCALDKGAFIGRDILLRQKENGTDLKLTALRYTGTGAPPRAHYPVLDENGENVGELSSGVLSPSMRVGIGMAYLPTRCQLPGTKLQIEVRGRLFPAEVVKKPFYKIPKREKSAN